MKKRLLVSLVLWPAVAVAQQGSCETPWFYFGNDPAGNDAIVAVHLIHVFDGTTGKVLPITSQTLAEQNCAPGTTHASDLAKLWTFPTGGAPGPGTFEAVPLCRTYMFCEGHSALADGRILNVGGMIPNGPPPNDPPPPNTVGSRRANLFHPLPSAGDHWNTVVTPPDMAHGRWYPTATTLPDGRVLACSGNNENAQPNYIPDVYNPSTNTWTPLPSAERCQQLYPYMFVLPDGDLVEAGPGTNTTICTDMRILHTSNWT